MYGRVHCNNVVEYEWNKLNVGTSVCSNPLQRRGCDNSLIGQESQNTSLIGYIRNVPILSLGYLMVVPRIERLLPSTLNILGRLVNRLIPTSFGSRYRYQKKPHHQR